MALNKATEKLSSNNLFIITLLVSLVVIGITVLASKYMITTIRHDGDVVAKKFTALNNLQENNKAAPDLVEDYKALGPTAILLDSALPTTSDFPSIISSMENMGQLTGVKVKKVSPSPVVVSAIPVAATDAMATGGTASGASPVPATTPQVYAFSIETSGTYVNTLKFLKTIETSARPIRVVDVKFDGTGTILATKIELETYYQAKAVLPITTEMVK